MATYLDIKRLIGKLLLIQEEITEESDLEVTIHKAGNEDATLIIPDEEIREAIQGMGQYRNEKLELYSDHSREVAVRSSYIFMPRSLMDTPIVDSVNSLTYNVGHASVEYCLFLIECAVDQMNENGFRLSPDLIMRSRDVIQRGYTSAVDNPWVLIQAILRIYTLTVRSDRPVSANKLRDYATAFKFHYMYKQSEPFLEITDIQDMRILRRQTRMQRRESIDTPPQRIYNAEVLDYYALAMESGDPFSSYISFYHVVEHYFDAVFRRKLTDEMRAKITHPDFSYKREDKLYELAKYVKKHMSSDDKSGKGNEFDSLKYVLVEYVPIDELKARINTLDANAEGYYQNSKVPFVSGKDTKVPWSDDQGVYTKLATRIYETRNALVHSKSEQTTNQYKPYKNKKDLLAEMALIRAVAELVLINTSKTL